MARYSLDTNVISRILKRDRAVLERYRASLGAGHEFIVCPIVYYELKRGLLRRDAKNQMAFMDRLMTTFHWQEFEKDVWDASARAWADARGRGESPPDMDFLIACHARHFSATVVTANVRHFERFPIRVENWETS